MEHRVREALRNELKRARTQRLRREFQEAACDPMFLRDLKDTEAAFRMADAETARMIPNVKPSIPMPGSPGRTRSDSRV